MQQLLEIFDFLKNRFGDDESAVRLIDYQTHRTAEWIDENTLEEPERSPRKLAQVEPSEKPHSTRSIFDDIDDKEGVDSA